MFKENVMLNDHLMIKQFQDFKLIKYKKKIHYGRKYNNIGKMEICYFS